MVRYWRTWCPLGKVCGKNNAQLCKKRTFKEAFDFLENHLKTSPKHRTSCSEQQREEIMQTADIKEDEEDYEEGWEDEKKEGHEEGYGAEAGGVGSEGGHAGRRYPTTPRDQPTDAAVASLQETAARLAEVATDLAGATAAARVPPPAPLARSSLAIGAPAARPPPIQLAIPGAGVDPLNRVLVSLRRAENGLTQASAVAVASSTVFTTEAANLARAIELLEQYIARNQ